MFQPCRLKSNNKQTIASRTSSGCSLISFHRETLPKRIPKAYCLSAAQGGIGKKRLSPICPESRRPQGEDKIKPLEFVTFRFCHFKRNIVNAPNSLAQTLFAQRKTQPQNVIHISGPTNQVAPHPIRPVKMELSTSVRFSVPTVFLQS